MIFSIISVSVLHRTKGALRAFSITHFCYMFYMIWYETYPDSKVHGANMGPIWGRQDPGGPHVGPMNFAIWVPLVVNTSRHWIGRVWQWLIKYDNDGCDSDRWSMVMIVWGLWLNIGLECFRFTPKQVHMLYNDICSICSKACFG